MKKYLCFKLFVADILTKSLADSYRKNSYFYHTESVVRAELNAFAMMR